MKRILVIGGSGFIGGATVRLIRKEEPKWKINVLDDLSKGKDEYTDDNGIIFGFGDVEKMIAPDVKDLDLIINFAAIHLLDSVKRPFMDLEINVKAVLKLLTLLKGTDCAYIHISTSSVYQVILGQPLTNNYAISKYAADLYTQLHMNIHGLKAAIVRPSQVYGHGGRGLINIFIDLAMQNKPYTIYGDGTQISRPTYVDDVASMIKTIIDKDGWGEVYTAIGEGTFTVNEIADYIDIVLQKNNKRIYLEQPKDFNFSMDILKDLENTATKTLGWEQPYGILGRLNQMVTEL